MSSLATVFLNCQCNWLSKKSSGSGIVWNCLGGLNLKHEKIVQLCIDRQRDDFCWQLNACFLYSVWDGLLLFIDAREFTANIWSYANYRIQFRFQVKWTFTIFISIIIASSKRKSFEPKPWCLRNSMLGRLGFPTLHHFPPVSGPQKSPRPFAQLLAVELLSDLKKTCQTAHALGRRQLFLGALEEMDVVKKGGFPTHCGIV